jgi:hypothetical protein
VRPGVAKSVSSAVPPGAHRTGTDGVPRSTADKQQRPIAKRAPVEVRLTSAQVLMLVRRHQTLRARMPLNRRTFANGGMGALVIAWTWRKGWTT